MRNGNRLVNLVLSGGGVKGIAYIGALETAEQRGYRWGNIAGVSAGALVGSLTGAGYSGAELYKVLDEFDFANMNIEEAASKLTVVSRYKHFCTQYRLKNENSIEKFLNFSSAGLRSSDAGIKNEFAGHRGNFLKNLIIFSKEGCLFDGDYLEEWMARVLARRGVKTFADLRGGISDKVNPRGYRVRMTAVDANRGKIVVLPDDIAFYGIDPDRLEVAKAVRMSTSVPFAFKPVEITKKEGQETKTYHLVDGGVFDNFPYWLITASPLVNKIGFRLDEGQKKKFLSLDTSLKILKALISKCHDIGIPNNVQPSGLHVVRINASKISFLDFNLSEEEKKYLYFAGKKAAVHFFNNFGRHNRQLNPLAAFIKYLFYGRYE